MTRARVGKNLKGLKFGRLTVFAKPIPSKNGEWLCVCDCGNKIKSNSHKLTAGHTRSCGCLQKELLSQRSTVHGMRNSMEYRPWANMKSRCLNPKASHYKYYGGRGIKVCERWKKFQNFFIDMGPRPSNRHSIERLDCNGNYEPGNCCWATIKEQRNNTRASRFLVMKGETKTLSQWSELYNLISETVRYRLSKGWTVEQALETRPRDQRVSKAP